MAIDYINKSFESTSTAATKTTAMGISAKAGSLIVLFVGGQASGTLSLSSVSDTKGGSWQIVNNSGSTLVAIAWKRTSVAMTTSDTITRVLSKTASASWMSCHVFEKAGSTLIDTQSSNATTTGVYLTPNVTGSDWLALSMAYWPSSAQMTTTEVDSSLSRDDSGAANPYSECWSKNGTTGSVQIGATIASSKYRRMIGITLPFQAMPGSGGRGTQSFFSQ